MAGRASSGSTRVRGARIALAVARFHETITTAMVEDARQAAKARGAAIIAEAEVHGTYDLPLVAKALLARQDVDAVVAIGVVITGETRHDELIAHAAAQSLSRLSLEMGKPVGLGVTGPGQSEAQARARIDRAGAAVESVLKQLQTLGSVAPSDARTGRDESARLRQP